MNHAYLVLGSNIDKERNLPRAVSLLARAGHLLAVSRAYETAPRLRADQPHFLNAAVLLATEVSAMSFKRDVIAGIEDELGRKRHPGDKNAPRTIDIDIVLWNDHVGRILGRPVPDPDLLRFAHVAVPLAEIAPDLLHPVTGERLDGIAGRLQEAALAVLPRPDIQLDA